MYKLNIIRLITRSIFIIYLFDVIDIDTFPLNFWLKLRKFDLGNCKMSFFFLSEGVVTLLNPWLKLRN
jgi:hypothetical protein